MASGKTTGYRWIQILNAVIDKFNITFVPVLNEYASECHWYHQAAKKTGGIVLSMPTGVSNSFKLANGLLALLAKKPGFEMKDDADVLDPEEEFEKLRALGIIEVQKELVMLEEDTDQLSRLEINIIRDENEFENLFQQFINHSFDKFSGKRAAKRTRIADKTIVEASAQTFVAIFQYAQKNFTEEQVIEKFYSTIERARGDGKT